jgi:hypothetical protein|tara:strand:+ start:517 stop:714 length:198 start_codon:yes stop_codon:yes gene_type:complete
MADQGYDAGKREGKIDALKDQQILHASRLDKHDTRIATLEKTAYIVMGAILLLEFAPTFQNIMGG